MKRPYRLAHACIEVPLNVPATALNLPKWFFNFSDLEYRQCSKGHFGAGASVLPNGKRISVNVESVGGHFAVQHFLEEISEPSRLKLVSDRSDAWIFHVLHIHPRVTCEMKLVPTSDNSCIFQLDVSVEHPSMFIKVASVLTLFQFFVRRHDDEEARLFAQSLANGASD